MLIGKTLKNFCTLTLKMGVNLQKGQGIVIICPIEQSKVALEMTKCAYSLGASIVEVRWEEQLIDRLKFINSPIDVLTDIPKWYIDSKDYLVKKGFCYVAIDADDPEAFLGVDNNKLLCYDKIRSKKLKKFSDAVMENKLRWCVVSVPTKKWAKKVFPNSKKPMVDLSNAIIRTMRLDKENPVLEWQKHIERLEQRANFLNSQNFSYLHYESKNGTNINVGLAKNHKWLSAKEKAKDNIDFIANMPTEEVFTCPHKDRVDGIVYSALPLSYNGQIIDDFSVTFKNGKAISFTAKKGYEILKNLLKTDKGVVRLGEVALIGKNSPISKEHTLFFNTLFDENASCHFAFGKAYPTTIDTNDTSLNNLSSLGANDSVTHVDFMIGSKDMNIDGVKNNGDIVPLFRDGEWII